MTRARELRFAFVFEDYDAALHLFRDVFGLETLLELDHEGGRGVILKAPRRPSRSSIQIRGIMWTTSRWAVGAATV